MENNDNRSVFDRLDSIEGALGEILKNSKQQQQVQPQVVNPQLNDREVLRRFVHSSKKEHVWFGERKEFYRDRLFLIIASVVLIMLGILSTILTSVAVRIYSTFSLFEGIWMVFVCFILAYAIKAKPKMIDYELKEISCDIFMQDADGTWRDTNQEKKRFKWFRRLSYIAAIANIIFIWEQNQGGIAVAATIGEVLFIGLSIGIRFIEINLFCMYDNFIFFTGRTLDNSKDVTLVFDTMGRKLVSYEEFKEKLGKFLDF